MLFFLSYHDVMRGARNLSPLLTSSYLRVLSFESFLCYTFLICVYIFYHKLANATAIVSQELESALMK